MPFSRDSCQKSKYYNCHFFCSVPGCFASRELPSKKSTDSRCWSWQIRITRRSAHLCWRNQSRKSKTGNEADRKWYARTCIHALPAIVCCFYYLCRAPPPLLVLIERYWNEGDNSIMVCHYPRRYSFFSSLPGPRRKDGEWMQSWWHHPYSRQLVSRIWLSFCLSFCLFVVVVVVCVLGFVRYFVVFPCFYPPFVVWFVYLFRYCFEAKKLIYDSFAVDRIGQLCVLWEFF